MCLDSLSEVRGGGLERERNRAQYTTWRNVGLPTGKHSLCEVTEPLKLAQRTETKGRDGNLFVATETQSGAWSRGQKGQKPPFRWCSGKH